MIPMEARPSCLTTILQDPSHQRVLPLSAQQWTDRTITTPTTPFDHGDIEGVEPGRRVDAPDSVTQCPQDNENEKSSYKGSDTSVEPSNKDSSPTLSTTTPLPTPSRRQDFAFIFITCAAQFLSLCALSQTVSPVMVLARYFNIENYGQLSWFTAAFSMSVGAFILPAGRLGDMFGHKRIYLIGWGWFSMWSLITGFSYHFDHVFFSICRAVQGIGPALLVPNAVALIGRTLPLGKKRMIGFACFGACGPLGAAIGSVLSAMFADLVWWPLEFWILSFVCLVIMGLAFVILPEDVINTKTTDTTRPVFDYWGTITGITGLVLINFALNQAPLVLWTEPYIGTLLGVGILFMVAFVLVELYATESPLIPIRGLSRDAVFALTCIVVGWASHGIWWYDLNVFLENLRGQSALLTSAQIAPVAITGVCFAFSTVWLIQRFGVSYIMFLSMTFFMVGSLLLATMPLNQTYWAQTFLSVIIMPGAMNLSYPTANILMSSALPREQQGIAASLVSTMLNYSISIGLGFAGTIDRYTMEAVARKTGWTRKDGNPVPLPVNTPEIQYLRLMGLRASWWFAVALGTLGMVIAGAYVVIDKRRKRAQKQKESAPMAS